MSQEQEIAVLANDLRTARASLEMQAAWLSQAHSLCADLGVAPGHIENRLFEAIGNAAKLMAQRDELLAAARNLRDVKGRHHTEHAFARLLGVVAKLESGNA
jgi:hypothetical protein